MKRILINATQNEEIRVALCKGNHLYDFDLENRTREQKKSNIYKGHVTRVEPSLEAVFVEYGSQRQGFLPIREISAEYLNGNPRDENIKKLIKEGDELIVQVEKEERGNKGAALSTYVSLAGRYLVLMPNNPRGGGISRQISGKLREDMKRMLGNLDLPKGMSVIIRTAGIGKTQEDLQHDLNHLLNIWQAIQEQNQKYPSPRLVHQEAGVVTRAVRDYLRDDIAEIWIDNENAYIEAAGFIDAVMPKQAEKLRKYTDYEPMFSRFNVEKQIETAYHREVRLPSGGSIVIDQTEALVSIDINSAKSTKGSDVAATAYHTNLEAADEIARQLRLRDMGGLVVIDFIDMSDNKHQKEVEKRLIDATKYDRARVQFGDISKFGLMEMSRQRLRPSLEESTGYICPRCHGNGMIRDLRSLSLSIMRQIEQIALKERQGEVQAEVPTDIAAFLLNEKRDSLVYLEQDSGTRITILPHAHLESPNFKLHFNRDGFAPSSYERITDTQQQEHSDLGYDVDWQTAEKERPEQQPTRKPRQTTEQRSGKKPSSTADQTVERSNDRRHHKNRPQAPSAPVAHTHEHHSSAKPATTQAPQPAHSDTLVQPQAVAWLSNLFTQAPQATTTAQISSRDAAQAIETLVNNGAQSLGAFGQVNDKALTDNAPSTSPAPQADSRQKSDDQAQSRHPNRQQTPREVDSDGDHGHTDDRRRRKPRKSRSAKQHHRKESRDEVSNDDVAKRNTSSKTANTDGKSADTQDKRTQDAHNKRPQDRNRQHRQDPKSDDQHASTQHTQKDKESGTSDNQARARRKSHSQRGSRGKLERGETLTAETAKPHNPAATTSNNGNKPQAHTRRSPNPNEVVLQVNAAPATIPPSEVVHLSLDDSKSAPIEPCATGQQEAPADDIVAAATTKTPELPPQRLDTRADKTADGDKATAIPVSDTKTDRPAKNSRPNQAADADGHTVAQSSTAHVPPACKSEKNPTADPVTSVTQQTDHTPVAAAEHIDKEAPTKTAAATVPAEDAHVTKTCHNSPNDKDASGLDLPHQALFADRYVTAKKFGQASNDPRVVRDKRLSSVSQTLPVASKVTKNAPAIRGTVGEFVRATLPEAQSHLATKGIIQSFIDAMAVHAQHAENVSDETGTDRMDFSNYGYPPLTAAYLSRFEQMTQAVSQFAMAQGKTDVEPCAIGKRASNDPRGQHPDYHAPAVLSVPTEQTTDADAHAINAAALTKQSQAADVSADSEQLLKVDLGSSDLPAHEHDTAQNRESEQACTISDDAVATVDADHTPASETPAQEEGQAAKSKTTIASYKNMIENVAEQLLPQTGMFNLTTPKAPKARSRKPKADSKKPAAEQIDTDHVDGLS